MLFLIGLGLMVAWGYIDISIYNIRVVDRKITSQNYNWRNGTYEWDEVRRNLNWEDGLISYRPDYNAQLGKDLGLIADQVEHIKRIDWDEQQFYTNDYIVKLCIEHKSISIKDTTLAKKIIDTHMSAYFELYDNEGCELLFKQKDRRYIFRDKIVMEGIGSNSFLINKAEELLATEVCETLPEFIWRYEGPYIWQQKKRVVLNFMKHYYKDWSHIEDPIRQASFDLKNGKKNTEIAQ